MQPGLSTRMLIGLVAGALLGVVAHLALGGAAFLDAVIAYGTDPIGRILLRLLFMLVPPLIVVALALGHDVAPCANADLDANGTIAINELVAAVGAATAGCARASAPSGLGMLIGRVLTPRVR